MKVGALFRSGRRTFFSIQAASETQRGSYSEDHTPTASVLPLGNLMVSPDIRWLCGDARSGDSGEEFMLPTVRKPQPLQDQQFDERARIGLSLSPEGMFCAKVGTWAGVAVIAIIIGIAFLP
jgi:hypothetical protein